MKDFAFFPILRRDPGHNMGSMFRQMQKIGSCCGLPADTCPSDRVSSAIKTWGSRGGNFAGNACTHGCPCLFSVRENPDFLSGDRAAVPGM